MSTSNPLLNPGRFAPGGWYGGANPMTFEGVIMKTALLLALLWVPAIYVWNAYFAFGAGAILGWLYLGMIGGLVVGLIASFVPRTTPVTAPVYAVFEGLFIGAFSAIMEDFYPGIVLQAFGLTLGVMAGMLLLFATGLIRVTQRMRSVVYSAMAGIFIAYLVSFILSFFGIYAPFIYGGGPIGIGFSLIVIGVIAFTLLVDFDNIQRGVQASSPKVMEWYAAFGLMVSLLWLYLELLRLLSKLRAR